jgi:pimeloyl-ACP methyl ester carboxylesterase
MIAGKLRKLNIGFETGTQAFREDNPSLVMIHGAGGSSVAWKAQTYLLRNQCNTFALDLPGHGKTGDKDKSEIGEYAQWLTEILAEVFDEPPYLMGHSMGGAIVQTATLSNPELVKGIILVGTGPRLQVAPMFLDGLKNDFENVIGNLLGYAYAPDAEKALVREGIKLMKEAGGPLVHADFSACNRFDLRREVDKINTPCLILCGEQDKLTPPALSIKLNKLIKNSLLKLLPSAGHMVMIENHTLLNEYVTEFILH